MKRSYSYFCIISILFLAVGCNDDGNDPIPQPEPELELKTVITGKYWKTRNSFTYIKNGIEVADTTVTLAGLRGEFGDWPDNRFYLGIFYCKENTIDRYQLTPFEGPQVEQDLLVCRGLYNIFLNPDTNVIRLSANDPEIAAKNIYEGMSMRLHSLKEDRVEFDMDINEFVRKEWAQIFEEAAVTITGIRVVWRSLTEEEMEEYHYFESPIEITQPIP